MNQKATRKITPAAVRLLALDAVRGAVIGMLIGTGGSKVLLAAALPEAPEDAGAAESPESSEPFPGAAGVPEAADVPAGISAPSVPGMSGASPESGLRVSLSFSAIVVS